MEKRFLYHFNALKNKTHESKLLTKYCNEVGFDNLYFKTIMTCEKSDLLYYEYLMINIFNPLGNYKGIMRPKKNNSKSFLKKKESILSNEYFSEIILSAIKDLEEPITSQWLSDFIFNNNNVRISLKKIAMILYKNNYYQMNRNGRRIFYKK
jgi:hypothetical protein